jgi:hypothetical protein
MTLRCMRCGWDLGFEEESLSLIKLDGEDIVVNADIVCSNPNCSRRWSISR